MIVNSLDMIVALLYVISTLLYGAYLFKQKDALQTAGLAVLGVGAIVHTLLILGECISLGYLPLSTLRVTFSLAAWSIAVVYFFLRYRFRIKVMGVYAAPLVACVYIISLRFPEIPAQTIDAFKSVWLVLHVITAFIGEASLLLACGAGILYLIQEHGIKSKKRGFFYRRLPSLELLDAVGYACIVIGFTAFTLGLIVGLIYAKMVWHRFASWDPKEIWSGISWLVYAALLHERIAVGWRGKRAAIMAIIAFAILMFSFLGVNLFLDGHHGGFTQWQLSAQPGQ